MLFAGHMIDRPGRAHPRFPPDRVEGARRQIASAVADLDGAVGVSGLACGGDLIFAESWLDSRRPLHAFLPRPRRAFLEESVSFAGRTWVDSFERVATHPLITVVDPDRDMLDADDPHTLNNLRMLTFATSRPPPLHGLFLWDGEGGDGPGGTGHLASEVLAAGGSVTIVHP